MSYLALYRKFRPDTFEEVKGQDHVVIPLRNQIKSGRIGHAYLFCGTRGTGKTSVAKIFAKAVNCEHPKDGSPCGECPSCRAIADGSSMNVIEIDAASNNGVDSIRQIRDEVAYSPAEGKKKVYIIDEVHMLSQGAYNALLKTLEEPPSYVIFILATTELHKVPVTILSRCQRYDFHRISQEEIAMRLKDILGREQVEAEEKAVRYIAAKADGGMRDALSLADQCISFYLGEKLTYDRVLDILGAVDIEEQSRLLRELVSADVGKVLRHVDDMLYRGRDSAQLCADFTWYLRNLMMMKVTEDTDALLDLSDENLALLREETALVREEELIRYIRIFSELSGELRKTVNQRVMLEVAMIRCCRPQMRLDEHSVSERLRRLERAVENGVVVAAGQSGAGRPAAGQPMAGGPAPETAFSQDAGEEPEAGVKAAPEDLQMIRALWKGIVDGVRSKIFAQVLGRAELKFNPAEGCEDQLIVVFPDFAGELYVRSPEEPAKELEAQIAEKTGKSAKVRFVLKDEEKAGGSAFAQIRVDEAVSAHIHMDVEIESDDEED